MYDLTMGHFYFRIDGKNYDWNGEYDILLDPSHKNDYIACIAWEHMDKYDSIQKERIIRDCIK